MNTITYDQLEVTGGLGLCTLHDLKIHVAENQHAAVWYKGISESERNVSALQQQLQGSRVEIKGAGTTIFCGLVQALTITEVNGYYEVEAELLSGSVLLDRNVKSRSFQDVGMTYGEVIRKVMAEAEQAFCLMEIGEDVPIGSPIIQYQETDWAFIRRLASHFGTSIYPEYTLGKPAIWLGVPQGREEVVLEATEYSAHISRKYHELGGAAAGYSRHDFFSYHVKSPALCKIGDRIAVHAETMTVCRLSGEMLSGELILTYQAGPPTLAAQKKEYNEKITGMSILGSVLQTERETLRLHLDIDSSQDIAGAYPYQWIPPSGNFMYLMPKVGTRVSLYFGSEDEGDAAVINCIRTNGGSQCPDMGDFNNRYLNTEHDKQLAMVPEQIGFSGTGKPETPLTFFLNDEDGIVLRSHLKVAMTALEQVCFEAPAVTLHSASEFIASRVAAGPVPGADLPAAVNVSPQASLNLEFSSQQNLVGDHMVYCGWEFIAYPPFEDAPKEGSFSWGKLFLGVAAGIAAVVVVTALVATGAIFVCGALALTAAATTAVVTGAVVGGAVVGGLYVGMQAYRDITSGNNSDIGTFIKEGAIGGTVGAVSGALTPVLGPVSTPVIHGAVGGAGYAAEWGVRNALGEDVPWSWTSFGLNVGLSAGGGSLGRVISNRATAKALASAADETVSKPGVISRLMSSDAVTSVYAAGNKAGNRAASAVGGEAGEAALMRLGTKANEAILDGITGGNKELARRLIAQDDYYRFRVNSGDARKFYINEYGITMDQIQYGKYIKDANGFSNVKDLNDFKSRIPVNAQELPWRTVPGGATDGVKYRWIDAEGNVWNVRAHSIDPSAPLGSNASQGWVYRVEVRWGGQGKTYYMDGLGNYHPENVMKSTSPMYNPDVANDTHIPLN